MEKVFYCAYIILLIILIYIFSKIDGRRKKKEGLGNKSKVYNEMLVQFEKDKLFSKVEESQGKYQKICDNATMNELKHAYRIIKSDLSITWIIGIIQTIFITWMSKVFSLISISLAESTSELFKISISSDILTKITEAIMLGVIVIGLINTMYSYIRESYFLNMLEDFLVEKKEQESTEDIKDKIEKIEKRVAHLEKELYNKQKELNGKRRK